MTIKINISNEKSVQVNDKTRIDVSGSFIIGDAVTYDLYEIDPDTTGTFYDVTDEMFIDWAYDTDTTKTITLKVTDSLAGETFATSTIEVLSVVDDNLFSIDSDILPYESDLLKWVQVGRNSFLDKHRAAQEMILNELDAQRIWKLDGTRYVAADIVDIQEFKEWSKFLTLKIIFEGISNDVQDVFMIKSVNYNTLAISAKKRASLRLDVDSSGTIEDNEKTNIFSGRIYRS